MAKRPTRSTTSPEVLPPVSDTPDTDAHELAIVTEAGDAIQSFMGRALAFFRDARALEAKSTATLMAARTLQLPQSGADDEVVQRFIKRVADEEKALEEHWTITKQITQLRNRLTQRRKVSEEKLGAAKALAQGLHNRYVVEARRQAEAEEQRRRQEAERVERERREREAAELEAQAVAAEEASEALSERETFFVERVDAGTEASRAAQFAGYKDGFKSAARLMASPKIQAAIEAKRVARVAREQAAAMREAPIEVEVETVRPDIGRAGTDRTRWSAEVTDADALINAVIEGKLGIPRDVLMPDQVKLNEYARSLHQILNRWPGVRAVSKTGTV